MTRCKEDEALVNAMLTQRHQYGWILDTRHPSIIKSSQSQGNNSIREIFVLTTGLFLKGGRSEIEQFYPFWKCLQRHLEKNIILQDSFMKLMEGILKN